MPNAVTPRLPGLGVSMRSGAATMLWFFLLACAIGVAAVANHAALAAEPVLVAPAKSGDATHGSTRIFDSGFEPGETQARELRVYVAGESIEQFNRFTSAPFQGDGSLNDLGAVNNDPQQYGWMVPFADRLRVRGVGVSVTWVGAAPWIDRNWNPSTGTYPSVTPGRTSAAAGTTIAQWLSQRQSELTARTYAYDIAFASRGGNDLSHQVGETQYKADLTALIRALDAGSSSRQHPTVYVTTHMPDTGGWNYNQDPASIAAWNATQRQMYVTWTTQAVQALRASEPAMRLVLVDQYSAFMANTPTTAFPQPAWIAANGGADIAKLHIDGRHPMRLASIFAGEIAADALLESDLQPEAGGSTFTNVTTPSGLASLSAGMYWPFDLTVEDLDGDGHADIVLGDHSTTHRFLLGTGSGTFSAWSVNTGTSQVWTQLPMDFDNDGRTDFNLIMDSASYPLLRNEGNRQFSQTPISQAFSNAGNAMAWADWNGDGRPDLALTSFNGRTLLRNDPSRYTNATASLPAIPGTRDQAAVYFADLNGDGWPDLLLQPLSATTLGDIFATATTHSTQVLFNKGLAGANAGFLAPVGAGLAGLPGPGVALGDYDRDGQLDILGVGSSPARRDRFQVRLYQASGGGFTDVTAASGVPTAETPIDVYQAVYLQSGFVDLDNDGWLDLFWCEPTRNRLFRNLGNGSFQDVSDAWGLGGTLGAGRPTRFSAGDLNDDGALDLLTLRAPWTTNKDGSYQLYRNRTPTARWLKVRLAGSLIRNAVGSKIQVYEAGHLGDPAFLIGYRELLLSTVHRSPMEQHFGLGSRTLVDVRAVFWPSGRIVDANGVASDQRVTLSEPPP